MEALALTAVVFAVLWVWWRLMELTFDMIGIWHKQASADRRSREDSQATREKVSSNSQ